jgi:hypothetical protein
MKWIALWFEPWFPASVVLRKPIRIAQKVLLHVVGISRSPGDAWHREGANFC